MGAFVLPEPSLQALHRGAVGRTIRARVLQSARVVRAHAEVEHREVVSIHYTACERIGLGAGNDLFRILSTQTGTTSVEGGAGNDTLNVRTIDGATTVAGDGLVAAFAIGPHTIAAGAGDALPTVIGLGQLDVDRLDVDDSGSGSWTATPPSRCRSTAGTASDVVVNRARNTFLGDEALNPMTLAMTGDASALEGDGTGDDAAVAVHAWAPSRGET